MSAPETIQPLSHLGLFEGIGGNGNGFGVTLGELANRAMLPTPTAQDGDNSTFPPSQAEMDTVVGFVMQTEYQTGGDSQLNPRFVAEMMGFPVDWLELPFQSTDVTQ